MESWGFSSAEGRVPQSLLNQGLKVTHVRLMLANEAANTVAAAAAVQCAATALEEDLLTPPYGGGPDQEDQNPAGGPDPS